jgi:hypothetical protein
MPYRKRIVVAGKRSMCMKHVPKLNCVPRVVGHPIHVKQRDKPTLDEVRQVQTQYIDELMRYGCLEPRQTLCFLTVNGSSGSGILIKMSSRGPGRGSLASLSRRTFLDYATSLCFGFDPGHEHTLRFSCFCDYIRAVRMIAQAMSCNLEDSWILRISYSKTA